MSGKYLLDTNAVIYALNQKLRLPPAHYAVSVITKMELLSWPSLTGSDEAALQAVLKNLTVFELLRDSFATEGHGRKELKAS